MSGEDKPFTPAEKIKLSNGDEITLPRMTLGKILATTDSMGKLIEAIKKKAPDLFDLFSGTNNQDNEQLGMHVIKALPVVIPLVADEVVTVLASYLNKDKQWILDQMDVEDLVAVATPFFASTTQQTNHLLKALNQAFGVLNQGQNPEISTKPSENS